MRAPSNPPLRNHQGAGSNGYANGSLHDHDHSSIHGGPKSKRLANLFSTSPKSECSPARVSQDNIAGLGHSYSTPNGDTLTRSRLHASAGSSPSSSVKHQVEEPLTPSKTDTSSPSLDGVDDGIKTDALAFDALSVPGDDTVLADKKVKKQLEFAPVISSKYKCVSRYPEGYKVAPTVEDTPAYHILLTTYVSYLILIIFGHVRDFFGKKFKSEDYEYLREQNGYAPLFSDFDSFYLRRLKLRLNDAFHRPTRGVPGRTIVVLDRISRDQNATFELTGGTTRCLNLASYNYLGFAQSEGVCADAVAETVQKYGFSSCSSRGEAGTLDLHKIVEAQVADFVGKPAATIYSQGFSTNATLFEALAGKNCLVISDELNHASIRFGCRVSGAFLRVFQHNDMHALEQLLRESIAQGQPRTHRPWKKIFVLVEGLYSMEGDFCNLPELVRLKRRYKFFLYVDEAHSIGALGPRSRGVCDYFGVDPADVDILMGTFTKSFGAAGGYVAADTNTIRHLQLFNAGSMYAESMSPIILQQILTSLHAITGQLGGVNEGKVRVERLAFNSRYLRVGLKRLGFIVYGQDDSPVIPLLLYHPGKMHAFSHELLRRKVAIVIVGYPATPLVTSRVRFCVSASHNKADLDYLLRACDEVGDIMNLKLSSGIAGQDVGPKYLDFLFNADKHHITPPRWPIEKVIEQSPDDVLY